MNKAAMEKVKQKAKDGIVEAIDAAVRKIEETEGPGAADRARKANDRGPSRIVNRKIAVTGRNSDGKSWNHNSHQRQAVQS